MDEKLKQIIIEAFECGVKWNRQKGHYLNALDFIDENKKQLTLYSVVKCNCKIPHPQMKVSENGISGYCANCVKPL